MVATGDERFLFVLSEDPATLGSGISARVRRYLSFACEMGPTVALCPGPSSDGAQAASSPAVPSGQPRDPHQAERLQVHRVGASRRRGHVADRLSAVLAGHTPDVACLPVREMAEAAALLVSSFRPTVIWYDMPSTFGVRDRVASHHARTIGCCQDSHQLLLAESLRAATSGASVASRLRRRLKRWAVRRSDRCLLDRFDRVVFVSEEDARVTLGSNWDRARQTARVATVPLAAADDAFAVENRPGRNPLLAFVGNFAYWPNADAIAWLCEELFPALQASLPSVTLRVCGKGTPPAVSNPAVSFLADFPSLADAYAGTWAAVVPVRFGAGMQTKLLEAAAAGVPVIAHERALRGAPSLRDTVWRFTTAAEFVDQALSCLATEPRTREVRIDRARSVAAAQFSSGAEKRSFRRAILGARQNTR